MPFTDKDLKRLKDGNDSALKATFNGEKLRARVHMDVEELASLLARLEAVELIREYAGAPQHEKWRLAEEAWLKEAGK